MTALGIVALCLTAWITTSLALGGLFIWLAVRRDWDQMEADYQFACDERDAEAQLRRIAYQRLAEATNHPSIRHLRSVR